MAQWLVGWVLRRGVWPWYGRLHVQGAAQIRCAPTYIYMYPLHKVAACACDSVHSPRADVRARLLCAAHTSIFLPSLLTIALLSRAWLLLAGRRRRLQQGCYHRRAIRRRLCDGAHLPPHPTALSAAFAAATRDSTSAARAAAAAAVACAPSITTPPAAAAAPRSTACVPGPR